MKLISNARALLAEQPVWTANAWIALCALAGWAGPDLVAWLLGMLR